ncbi:class I SAM-dependent methyltransferase [Sporolactobacillus shoreicorticis]|uniref:Class I SAM-dependent methyltransferase n=1 Tax=Sporolactobacillus shoreicorticis TaxID=1923877 RepID=A0ABW5S273_9BACL|nr:class I SAM-dependent methyltransferase [Sporolactobacillus shoreicorticis]MCO7125228.1 class I SAM-dependent methyltransferase [Sporolactobacillus shoreicorticis]
MKQTTQAHGLYDGAAYYYLKYRGQYSERLIRTLALKCGLDGKGRLLDLGCGTGKLTFPMARYFSETVGIDVSSDMLQSARSQCELLDIHTMKWLKMPSEQMSPELGSFRMITAGDAFHWMDRERVLKLSYDLLEQGGALALVGQGHLLGSLSLDWQQAVQRAIDKWFPDFERRKLAVRHEQLLAKSSFHSVLTGEIHSERERDIPSIIGYLYSTSTCRKSKLGKNTANFEKELYDELKLINSSGTFKEPVTDYYIIAFK